MSEILIKGIEMPKDNNRLALFIDKDGDVTVFDGNEFNRITDAIELPPHGRLVDADEVFNKVTKGIYPDSMEYTIAVGIIEREIKEAPTVIPSSEKTE